VLSEDFVVILNLTFDIVYICLYFSTRVEKRIRRVNNILYTHYVT